jgi:hypothetical protein
VWGLRRRSCALSTCCAICCQALQTRSESDFHPAGIFGLVKQETLPCFLRRQPPRARIANSVFRSLADIMDACEMAWNRFATNTGLVRSL